jgi:hypothetical protein
MSDNSVFSGLLERWNEEIKPSKNPLCAFPWDCLTGRERILFVSRRKTSRSNLLCYGLFRLRQRIQYAVARTDSLRLKLMTRARRGEETKTQYEGDRPVLMIFDDFNDKEMMRQALSETLDGVWITYTYSQDVPNVWRKKFDYLITLEPDDGLWSNARIGFPHDDFMKLCDQYTKNYGALVINLCHRKSTPEPLYYTKSINMQDLPIQFMSTISLSPCVYREWNSLQECSHFIYSTTKLLDYFIVHLACVDASTKVIVGSSPTQHRRGTRSVIYYLLKLPSITRIFGRERAMLITECLNAFRSQAFIN